MSGIIRKKIIIKGVVQGVGFRPHVYKLALERSLSGWVRNDASGVTIEAQGRTSDLARFIKDIGIRKPPAARIDSLKTSALKPGEGGDFAIIKSGGKTKAEARIPPDLALCADCRRELLDPSDRRYLYPFTNCTNCGPRFTIVKNIPYDRPLTTMKRFRMCPDCLAEYRDPLDRRFHAQPNACPVCGPKVRAVLGGKRFDGLNALGWHIQRPKASFYVWAKIPPRYTSATFAKALLDRADVVATPGNGFGEHGEGYVRFALTVDKKRIKEAVGRIKTRLA